jgi:membrane protease YdiL (CAAX protease family)
LIKSSSTADIFHQRVTEIALAVGAMLLVSVGLRELLLLIGILPRPPRVGLNLPPWLSAIAMLTVLPIVEETIFRGWLLSWLRRPIGFWPAALIANIAWVAFHLPTSTHTATVYFAIGLVLSALLWRTGKLWTCIVAHAVYNILPAAFILIFLQ